MEVSKGKDFSFPSGVAQKIVNIYLSQKNWPPNKSAHNVSRWDDGWGGRGGGKKYVEAWIDQLI